MSRKENKEVFYSAIALFSGAIIGLIYLVIVGGFFSNSSQYSMVVRLLAFITFVAVVVNIIAFFKVKLGFRFIFLVIAGIGALLGLWELFVGSLALNNF